MFRKSQALPTELDAQVNSKFSNWVDQHQKATDPTPVLGREMASAPSSGSAICTFWSRKQALICLGCYVKVARSHLFRPLQAALGISVGSLQVPAVLMSSRFMGWRAPAPAGLSRACQGGCFQKHRYRGNCVREKQSCPRNGFDYTDRLIPEEWQPMYNPVHLYSHPARNKAIPLWKPCRQVPLIPKWGSRTPGEPGSHQAPLQEELLPPPGGDADALTWRAARSGRGQQLAPPTLLAYRRHLQKNEVKAARPGHLELHGSD